MPTDEISSPATSSRSAFQVGQKLAGIYILRSQISDRAEAEIWLAHDEVLGKDVSLHFIPAVLRGDTRAMGEIRQEIKRNRQLIHPGILRVYDLVEEPEWSAISMDWFEGESLATALAKRPDGFFEPADVRPWLQQICHTLDDIHKIQIFHRDVAPHNIFVDARGKVLLAKFGISRVIEDAVARVHKGSGPDPRIASISPQSLDGENPSKSDDIYSIGAMIYELLTGELPFVGADLLPQIRKNPPQPMTERRAQLGKRGGAIPPVWEKWVAAALGKATTDRPTSAGELAAKLGLSGKLAPEPVAVPAPAPVQTVTAPVVATAAAAAHVLESGAEKAPAPAEAAPAAVEPSATTAPGAEAAAPAPAPTAAVPGNSHEPETAATSEAKPEPAPEPKVELPPRGGGIKLPPSRFAAVGAAESGRKAAGKFEEQAKAAPAEEPTAKSTDKPSLKGVEKPLSLDDDGDDSDTKEANGSDEYKDAPAPRKSNAMLVGALVLVVGVLAYFFNRPAKPEPKPATGTPVNAQVTPAPGTPRLAKEATPRVELPTPSKEIGLIGERNITSATPTATPGAIATPMIPKATPPVVEVAVAANADPETEYLNAVKQEQSAKAALRDAEKVAAAKEKEIMPIVKRTEPLLKVRTKQTDEVKAAEEAAETARKAAEAKAKAVEDARKAQADWEAANGPKLAEFDKATLDLKATQEKLAESKRQTELAAQALAKAETARREHSMEREAEAARKAAQKAEADRVERETREREAKIKEEMEALRKRLRDLEEESKKGAGRVENSAASTSIATPGPKPGPTPVATPGAGTTTTRPIPPPPPSPKPNTNIIQGEMLPSNTVPLTPATPIMTARLTSPTPRIISSTPKATPDVAIAVPSTPPPATPLPATPPPATPAIVRSTPTQGATAPDPVEGESSLGLKFAPVGDVAFCLWPTRIQDFEVFAKETGFRGTSWKSPGFRQAPNHPVVMVSWNDAIAFCKWLTERDLKKGFLTKGQIYRLPTDLEFSKAIGLPEEPGKTPEARDMGVPDVFPWGTQWPPPPNFGNYTGEETGSDVAIRGYDDGYAWTSPVGSFPPNKYGLYDVGGNVWQWCMDNWSPESKVKVLRGGSWYNGALKLSLLSSCRVSGSTDMVSDNYGFRVVRASENGKAARPR